MTDTFEMMVPNDWTSNESIIKVLGVGGAGCNAVNYMYNQKIQGCCYAVCNTDSQALRACDVPVKLQLGAGLGAGTNPIEGRNAALESQDKIDREILTDNTKMLFITAGMGGGTGTGAAPVIAKMSKDKGILTVGVVTLPFKSEGREVFAKALDGINELEKNVDSLLLVNNEKLYDYFGDLLIQDAFPKADEVLATAVKGIIEIITTEGHINVDFKDVKTMMTDSGMALMGCGTGTGENRIEDATKNAFESPLLNDFDLKTAKHVLLNITVGRNEKGLTMKQKEELEKKIAEKTGGKNNFKEGLKYEDDPEWGDKIQITAIATGFRVNSMIGPEIDMGNIIPIDSDYHYDRGEVAKGEGISLETITSSHIGFNTTDNQARFTADLNSIPLLLSARENDIVEYTNTPAIRRIQKQK